MIFSQRFNAARAFGLYESPDCEPGFLRARVRGLAEFGPSKNQSSSTKQSASNSQVGVEGGEAVGSGNSGAVAQVGGLAITTGEVKGNNSPTTINVTDTNADAANDALAFQTIDSLIEAQANNSTSDQGQPPSPQGGAQSPVIISTGSNQVPSTTATSGLSSNWTVYAAIGGFILAAIVFFRTKGKSA